MPESSPKLSGVVWLLLAASVFIQSFSFLSLKVSTLVSGLWSGALLLLAFLFLGLRAALWQSLLRRSDLSQVYPFSALVQVLILVYAVVLFNEPVAMNHLAGLALMLGGTVVLARG